ncbi:hypothetical protein DWW12_08630 [Collinsella sp. AF14-35]|nr:hypothetical protein DWW12_08630 [Collinsella sp. AF14-35]
MAGAAGAGAGAAAGTEAGADAGIWSQAAAGMDSMTGAGSGVTSGLISEPAGFTVTGASATAASTSTCVAFSF